MVLPTAIGKQKRSVGQGEEADSAVTSLAAFSPRQGRFWGSHSQLTQAAPSPAEPWQGSGQG